MKNNNNIFKGLKSFMILWATQALSALGSSMTSFALIIWTYQQQGSALTTALLSVCSYAPYVLFSIFAGALSDKFNKKVTMLVCDTIAVLVTISVLFLMRSELLEVWHLYVLNAINGLMNTFQQPASDVAVSMIVPKEQYQRIGGLQSLSGSLVSIFTPVIASALLAFSSINIIIAVDLITFAIAFISLAFFIKIPHDVIKQDKLADKNQSFLQSSLAGMKYLRSNKGVFYIILFLAMINLTASMFNAALPAMLLSRNGGSELALGIVNTCTGIATVIGSIIASVLPIPKSRVKVICITLLLSMGIENVLLAFGRSLPIWCIGAICGWLLIPVMSTNLNALLRSNIPIELQGRVYSTRNALQFFTIPIGFLLGGLFVDKVFEPIMAMQTENSILAFMFGTGKGSGAGMFFLCLAIIGELTCVIFYRNKHIWQLDKPLK